MATNIYTDPATSIHERSWKQMWSDYSRPDDRVMRDCVYGQEPWIFERSLNEASDYISEMEFFRVYNASRFAQFMGCPLNAELTIAWNAAGYLTPKAIDLALERFLDRLRKFLKHRGYDASYYWTVIENGPVVGRHSHMAIHVPSGFSKDFKKWLDATLLKADRTPMTTDVYCLTVENITDFRRQWYWFRYCMKGIDPLYNGGINPTAHQVYGLRNEWCGPVDMKRVRLSQSLNKMAQSKVDYDRTPQTCRDEGPIYDDSEYERGIFASAMREFNAKPRLEIVHF